MLYCISSLSDVANNTNLYLVRLAVDLLFFFCHCVKASWIFFYFVELYSLSDIIHFLSCCFHILEWCCIMNESSLLCKWVLTRTDRNKIGKLIGFHIKIFKVCMLFVNLLFLVKPSWRTSLLIKWISQNDVTKLQNMHLLTLWELAHEYIVPRFWPKTSSFQLLYQCYSSSADCARELFKGLNGLASLLVALKKIFFGWGLRIFCEWHHKWNSLWVILAHVTWPKAQPLG